MAARTPTGNVCHSFAPGHALHWIPGIHSLDTPRTPRLGHITSIERGVITVDFEGQIGRYRNHHIRKIRAYVKTYGTGVMVDEGWGVLRIPSGPVGHSFGAVREDLHKYVSCKYIADGKWAGMF
jgi:hypothetical protein